MTGSLQINPKDNMYFVVLNMKDQSGKRKQKWISTGIPAEPGNKRKAEKALRDTIKEYEDKKIVVVNNIKFSQYMDEWLESMKNQIEEGTWISYQYTIGKHIIPYFDKLNVTLQDIEPLHIQKYYNEKLKEGLSPNTIKHHHANIRKALQEAMLMNLIPYNPADRVKLPKIHKYTASYYNAEQAGILLESIMGTPIETPVILCIYYGLRRSEVLGLKWKSVDFVNKTISIDTTVTSMKGIREKKRTKNASSNRVLPLVPDMEIYLEKLLKRQKDNMLLFGSEYVQNEYLCKWDNGSAIKPDYLSHKFKTLLIKNNLPIIRFHDIRHSCASILSASGYDIKKISDWLGHSDINTTANLYTHLEFRSKIDMGNSIQNLLKPKMIESVR